MSKPPEKNEITAWLSDMKQAIYGYDSVSEDVIWGIIVKALPALEKEIDQLLKR